MSLITLPMGCWDVVVIDVPWPWQARSEKGLGKSPEAHYRTMEWHDIVAINAADLLAPGGILFAWGTWPLLDRQISVVKQWGLTYKSGGSWAKRTRNGKLRVGCGHIQRTACEPYIIATRFGCPFYGKGFVNLIETFSEECVDGLAREHSRKPDEFYRRVEDGWPNARRCDIFAREPREGWTVWGDQTEKFSS